MNDAQQIILEAQTRSMRANAPRALTYHFNAYDEAHKGIRLDLKSGDYLNVQDQIGRLEIIRFELIAYLNWLGRIYHFVKNLEVQGCNIPKMDEGFLIFRKKWAAHRSPDDPMGESDLLHMQVLFNLDTSLTFNNEGQYVLELSENGNDHSFNLYDIHPLYISYLDKLFGQIETATKTQQT